MFNNVWPDKFLALKGFERESTEIMIMHIDAMMIFDSEATADRAT